jgi:Flp pilus assembly protein TadD
MSSVSRPRKGSAASKSPPPRRDAAAQSGPAAGLASNPPAWALGCLAVLATAVVYARTSTFDFAHLDDTLYVTENPQVLAGLTLDGLRWAFSFNSSNYWHPLTWLSLMLDRSLYGDWAGGFHLTNAALHCANVALLYALVRRWLAPHSPGAKWPALAVVLALGLHPVHVESVAWITERKDVLFLFFGLICLHCYTGRAERGRSGFAGLWPALLAYAASLLAKPMLVTLPALLVLLDFWPLKRLALPGVSAHGEVRGPGLRSLLIEKLPFLALSAAVAATTLGTHPASHEVIVLGLGQRLSNAAGSYLDYLRLLVFPSGLAVVYPFPLHPSLAKAGMALALIAAVSALVLRQLRLRPQLAVGWFWFLGTLTPVIVPPKVGLHVAYADRWTYFPFIGLYIALAILAGEGLSRLRDERLRRRVTAGLLAALCMGLATLSTLQLRFWRSPLSLYEHALAVTQGSHVIMNNYGLLKMRAGDFDVAEKWLLQSLDIAPNYGQALANLGHIRVVQGRFPEALDKFAKALEVDTGNAIDASEDHYAMGYCLAQLGRFDEAEAQYLKALDLRPNYPMALNDLGNIALVRGDARSAEKFFERAVSLAPDYAVARGNLARAQAALAE